MVRIKDVFGIAAVIILAIGCIIFASLDEDKDDLLSIVGIITLIFGIILLVACMAMPD